MPAPSKPLERRDPLVRQLQATRRNLQISADDLARSLKVTGASIRNWEAGRTDPNLGILRRWAKMLGQDLRLDSTLITVNYDASTDTCKPWSPTC